MRGLIDNEVKSLVTEKNRQPYVYIYLNKRRRLLKLKKRNIQIKSNEIEDILKSFSNINASAFLYYFEISDFEIPFKYIFLSRLSFSLDQGLYAC